MPFDIRSLDGSLWLAEPSHIRRLAAQVAAMPTCPSPRELVAERNRRLEESSLAASKAIRSNKSKTGIINIHGPITQRFDAASWKTGGCSCEEIGVALDSMLADASIGAIVLNVDSPGGSSYGVEELSDKIYAAREKKRVYAVADSLAASAAFWIATSAEQLMVTPGGDVGSVGVYAIHVDESRALDAEGITVNMVSAGKFKAEFSSHRPLSDDAKAHLQESVDATHDKFLKALKRNRNTSVEDVRKNFGQGRVVSAEQAVTAGMADRVMSFEALMHKLTGSDSSESQKRTSTEVLRLRHEWNKAKMGRV